MLKDFQELQTIKIPKDNIWPSGWGQRTCVMGVINITPDSFSDGGIYFDPSKALDRAIQFVNEGVDIIDIGAQSTKPGAIEVGYEEEIKRLKPVLLLIRKRFPGIIISVDTFNSKVADFSMKHGANWINDVSGGRHDSSIFNIASKYQCPYILTHSRGNSKTMDKLTKYNNIVDDVIEEMLINTKKALSKGIKKENILWDIGLGFAKTTEQNLSLLRNLNRFLSYNYSVMVGPSKKRFIGDITLEKNTNERIWGTAAVTCMCVQSKVNLIRVHDIYAMKKTILMAEALWN
tara:strand:- start:38289 stop:39158 length:870 start_codon:yes stop_codon:yes gene_type:complete